MSEQSPSKKPIEQAISVRSEEINAIDDYIILRMSGVSQALDDLRQALNKVDTYLGDRAFHKASQLGYREVSSSFIFLQRTLGSLQEGVDNRGQLISTIAMDTGLRYEDVWPHIKPLMTSAQPRKQENE